MKTQNSIKDWSEDDRPREKLCSKGAAALSNAELLAILINSGTRTHSALDLAKIILANAHDNLHELGRLGLADLQKTKGIGEARAITIAAALELGRRRQMADALIRPKITSSEDAVAILQPLLADLSTEVFVVLFMNNAGLLLKHENISNGGLTATHVDVRIILKSALAINATRLIVAHNHPTGNTAISKADIEVTSKIKAAASVMDIALVDHIVIAGSRWVSLADEGHL